MYAAGLASMSGGGFGGGLFGFFKLGLRSREFVADLLQLLSITAGGLGLGFGGGLDPATLNLNRI